MTKQEEIVDVVESLEGEDGREKEEEKDEGREEGDEAREEGDEREVEES